MKDKTIIQKIENQEEIREILKNESPSMTDWYLKEYDFFKLNDGLVLEIKKAPSIQKTIWYDDETEPPKLTEKLFIDVNMRYHTDYILIEDIQENAMPFLIFTRRISNIVTIQKVYGLCDYLDKKEYAISKDMFIRELTTEEIKTYDEIMRFYINKYIERLKKYYKRYYNHIYVQGYWANR